MRKIIVLALALAGAGLCFGYIRNVTSDGSQVPLFRVDNAGIQFNLNQGITANLQSSVSGSNITVISAGSDPVAAVRSSQATWNAVGTANILFLPLKSTSTGINGNDNVNVISAASNANELSLVGGPQGALMVTVSSYNSNGVSLKKGTIVDTDIIVNPSYAFSTDGSTQVDFQSVITHELGHSLGSNHSTLVGTSMFWANSGQRFLSSDEIAFVSTVYPKANGGLAVGTLSGVVTAGGQPAAFAMISMFDPVAGTSSGTLTAGDGTYSVQVPPGSYQLIVEPLTNSGLIQPGNLYLNVLQAAQATAIAFQPTLVPGLATVTAGGSTTTNISVTTGASSLQTPLVTASAVNGRPGGAYSGGPVVIQSGQSLDLVLDGAGYDASLNDTNFKVFGPGITIKPGSVRVDPNTNFNGVPILRITLNVAASATQYLATVFITKGASTYSITGGLIVTPPAPAFTSKSLVSAASYVGVNGDGAVSPGGIYSLYAPATGVSSLGPATPVSNGGYDAYGLLPTNLAGVSVTFDGIPAPLFFVWGGQAGAYGQINFQAPFELAGKKTTQVIVNYLGSTNNPVTVPVVAAQPAFFTVTPTGTDSIAVNQDGRTLNSAQNPEARGNYVTIYGTGVGSVACAVATGASAPGGCTASDTVIIGGQAASGQYFFPGLTPTAVGLAQWTVQIPSGAPTGAQTVIATDKTTGAATPKGTIYIK